jgi:hypothetical protein
MLCFDEPTTIAENVFHAMGHVQHAVFNPLADFPEEVFSAPGIV